MSGNLSRRFKFLLVSLLFPSLFLLNFSPSHCAEIKLAWDPNSESDLAGYKVYYGTSPRMGADPNSCGVCGYSTVFPIGKVTTYIAGNLVIGQTYYFSVTALDTSQNQSGFSNEVSGIAKDPAANFQLILKAGPNLISFPVLSGQVTPADLFAPISNQYKNAYGYFGCNATDPWKMYDPALPSFVNDLQYIDNTRGVWIEMKQDSVLSLSGGFPTSISTPLCFGWNLISYAGSQSLAVATALSSISGKFEKIYTYKSSDVADPWKIYDPSLPSFVNDLTAMEPGLGYWIYMKEACNLVINN